MNKVKYRASHTPISTPTPTTTHPPLESNRAATDGGLHVECVRLRGVNKIGRFYNGGTLNLFRGVLEEDIGIS